MQNRALKRLHFKPNEESIDAHYHLSGILKLEDYVTLQNFLFAYDHFHNLLPLSLQNIFILVENTHEHNTRITTQNVLSPPLTNTKKVWHQ